MQYYEVGRQRNAEVVIVLHYATRARIRQLLPLNVVFIGYRSLLPVKTGVQHINK